MQLLALNDLSLTWYTQQGTPVTEPGAALVENDAAVYGNAALARARLAPRGFQDQHWQLLNSDSLAVNAPGVQNNADLIYQHLQQLAAAAPSTQSSQEIEIICAVPGTVSNDQLGLLLGIASEAGITIRSFANSAVLYCLNISLPGEAWCVDIQNRRGILTRLTRDSTTLSSSEIIDIPQLGMNGLIDGWLHQLTDQFVARSRFDPLRVAETEQQLFDQVRAWLPTGGTLGAAVDHQGHQRAVDLSYEDAADHAQQRYREVRQKLPAQATVVLTPSASMLPGFAEYLGNDGHTILNADADALWANASTSAELLNPPAVHFITSLATSTAAAVTSTANTYATHVLSNHTAVPLADIAQNLATLAGSTDVGYQVTAESEGVTINETDRVSAQPLAPGDRLTVSDKNYICIRVEDGTTA